MIGAGETTTERSQNASKQTRSFLLDLNLIYTIGPHCFGLLFPGFSSVAPWFLLSVNDYFVKRS